MDEKPAVTVSVLKLDPRCEEVFRRRRAGQKLNSIASEYGVTIRTVQRWLKAYHESYCKHLEESPVVNLIAEELAKLEAVESEALMMSSGAKIDSIKQGYMSLALKAMKSRQDLLLHVGVLPKEPTKIYTAVQEMKAKASPEGPRAGDDRTEEEIKADMIQLLKQVRSL